MELQTFIPVVESMLFSSDKPVPLSRLVEAVSEMGVSESFVQEALAQIEVRYQDPAFGFELREAQGGFHFCTKAVHGEVVIKLLSRRPFRLGKSTLETMAIIAYRQPITRAEIDQVRGIDSSHLLRTLIERGLVKMAGKAEVPGRPVQYATTPKFLEVVGLPALSDLPPLSELDQLEGDTADHTQSLEEGLERFMADTDRAHAGHLSQEKSGLEEIETLLEQAGDLKKEIFASPEAAEVAGSNEEAAVSGVYPPHPKIKKTPAPQPDDTFETEPPSEPITLPTEPVVN